MRGRASWRGGALAFATVLAVARGATGQGWIEAGVDRSSFAVERTRSDVRVRIEGRVAHFEVSEWFANRGRRLAEGEYLYPLPGEAVFQGFSLFQGETELRGEIMDAERARAVYEGIVRRHADPALIELAGRGMLRARIFPIQPGEERKITLRYTQVLERTGSALQLLYAGGVGGRSPIPHPVEPGPSPRPLPGPTAFPSPQPRAPLDPEDPDRQQHRVRSSFRVEVTEGSRFLDPFSPTHPIQFERRGGRLTISVAEEIQGRLALFLPLAGESVGLTVATHRAAGEPGYFMLTLTPGRGTESVEPRDVTIVVDVSGSMSGGKLEQAKDAVGSVLETLSREDRFRLVAFSSAVRAESADWNHAGEGALLRARAWIESLVADGGTNIGGALEEALRLESPRGRLPIVLFLTDGIPSVGERSPEKLADMTEARAGRTRIFAFGVGHDVNTHLLDRLGEAGRGDTDYVHPDEDVGRAVALLAEKIRRPVLTDLELVAEDVRLSEVYPVRLPDVFAGEELVLFGRFEGEREGTLAVRGERGGRRVELGSEISFPLVSDANAYIPRLWASRKLGHLERQIWTQGESESLIREIRRIALRYGLPSRYSAYLVEESGFVAEGPPSTGGSAPPAALRAPVLAPTSGAEAVKAAEVARGLRSAAGVADLQRVEEEIRAETLGRNRSHATKALGGRLFRSADGVWIDAAHDGSRRVVEVRAFSSAYFAVLRALPELSAVLAELERVVVAGAEVSLRFGERGLEQLSNSELREVVTGFRGGAAN